MHTIKARRSEVHYTPQGPRVEVTALIVTKDSRTVHPFRCICGPEDEHDHEAMMAERAELWKRHDAVIDGYRALAGKKGTSAGVPYEITDCHIRFLGPADWELYVSWLEDYGAKDPVRQIVRELRSEPDSHTSPGEIVKRIRQSVAPRGQVLKAAHRLAALHRRPK